MASEKLSALASLAGGQVPTDLAYVVDVSAGVAGSKKSTLDDLFAEITKNITDGALRFAGFAAPAVSAASKGAVYFSTADNTFKGSRNAGAYENLLFGSGGNTRVTVWNTGADQLTGYAEFLYQASGSGVGNRVVRLTISGSGQDCQFYTDNTFASTPSSAGITNLGAINATRLTTGSFPIITMNQGRSGPAYPQSLDVLGVLRWRSTNNTTFNEAAYIQALAGENHSGVASGSGLEIWSTALGATTAIRRVMIGAGPVGQTIVFNADSANTLSTNFGTNTRFAIRTPTTNDNVAQVIISGASSTTLKELVLQAGVSQTANIFECQNSAGAVLYSISAAGAVSFGGAQVITVSSANAFAVGPNGVTNSTFNVVTNVPSAATGLSVTGNAAGSGVQIDVSSSGTNESLLLNYKGNAGVVILKPATTVTGGSLQVPNDTSGLLRPGLNSTGNGTALATYGNGGIGNGAATYSQTFIAGAIVIGASGNAGGVAASSLITTSGLIGFAGNNTTVDAYFGRIQAAAFRYGAADAAAPVAQTLSVQNVVAGTTNTAGANWTRRASAGTGTGVGGAHIWEVAPAGSSGTSQNAFVEAMRIAGSGAFIYPSTNTASGTTGAQTINKVSGSVNFAAAATTLTVTNSLVTANSLVFCTILTNDGTATIKNVVPTAGSFTITLAAAATAETRVGFFVINQ